MTEVRLVIIGIAAALLVVAGLLVLIRMAKGPSTLDRVVAADVMLAVVISALGLEAALNRHGTTVPVILAISLLGFTGALSMARFVADRDKARRWNVPSRYAELVGRTSSSAAPAPPPEPPEPPEPDEPNEQDGQDGPAGADGEAAHRPDPGGER
jgi:multicomponent Na+:H+ antiporter subunit F